MSKFARVDVEPGSVVGLNYNGGHDSSVSVVAPDGTITFACSLERVSRRKMDGRFPHALLELIDFSCVKAVALPCYSPHDVPSNPTGQRFHSLRHSEKDYPIRSFPPSFYSALASIPVPKVFVGHELAHAASGFYLSQFEDAAVLAYDAGMYNEPWFGGVFHAVGRNLQVVEYFPGKTNAKIASLYAIVTGLLGYKPLRHEGKLTGLAAYAKPNPACVEVMEALLTERYRELEGVARWINAFDPNEPPQFVVDTEARAQLLAQFSGHPRATIAASLQHLTEEHVLGIVRRIKSEELSERLCLAGGLFANVRLNQRIHHLWGGGVFIAPPMGDDGAGLGAALHHVIQDGHGDYPARRVSMYLGFSYAEDEAKAILDRRDVAYDKLDQPAPVLAQLLAEGRTIGLFTGAMEFGPRALGHRSILASATDPGITARLNQKLKRTEFMPFAPITRAEDAQRMYSDIEGVEHTAEFMTVALDATAEMADSCPAVVHVDGTARPQIVEQAANPFLHAVLTEYAALTQVSSVINTSFNIHEEPIVCSPEDALRGFLEARIDYLYLEGFLISLERNLPLLLESPSEQLPALREGRPEESVLIEHLWGEVHYLRTEAEERLALVQQLHAECERYREHIAGFRAEIDRLRLAPNTGAGESESTAPGAAPDTDGALASAADDWAAATDAEKPASGALTLVLEALNRLEARLSQIVEQYVPPPPDQRTQDRLLALEFGKQQAEAAAEARLRVIEEQQGALDHYRYWRLGERINRSLKPRIGVLYQYPPQPLDIPTRYHRRLKSIATPKISIVTPSYNQGQFIERTIRSLLEQRYPGLEYVVQDGASTDKTLEVLERFDDSIASVQSTQDEGLANALNRGFARTTGEIMAYLNSDDLLLPGALDCVAAFFNAHPSIDVVYGHRIVIDEYEGEIGRWVLPPHDDEVLSWADYVPQETLFWRRHVWDAIGGAVDESFQFAVDWDLLIRFRSAGARMARLPRFLGAFRVHPHQKTSSQMVDVGAYEMGRLRERVHGRVVTHKEISRALRGYLRRHVIYHKLYRLGVLRY